MISSIVPAGARRVVTLKKARGCQLTARVACAPYQERLGLQFQGAWLDASLMRERMRIPMIRIGGGDGLTGAHGGLSS
jgi:hypothetical protein